MVKEVCPVFGFHGVSDDPRRYDVDVDEFVPMVNWISENYSVLTLSDFWSKLQTGSMPEKPAVMTFDDGLRSAEQAAEILEQKDIGATFFLISGLVGEYWEGKETLGREEVKGLVERGHGIGAHTVSHPKLTHLSDDEVRREVQSSADALSEISGTDVSSFAYPYGDVDGRVKEIVGQTSIDVAVTSRPSRNVDSDFPYSVPRLGVLRYHTLKDLRDLARGNNRLYQKYWRFWLEHLRDTLTP